jgi:serine/threonine protein kinase
MLFEMLAGAVPFDGPDIRSILLAHGTRVVPRVHDVAPGVTVPYEVEHLIRRGMAKEPRDRMQSASDYLRNIDDCLAVLGHTASPRLGTRPPTPPSATVPLRVERPSPPVESAGGVPASTSRKLAIPAFVGLAAVAAVVVALALPTSEPPPAASAPVASPSDPVAADPEPATAPTPSLAEDSDRSELDAQIARATSAPHRKAVKQLIALRAAHPDSAAVVHAIGQQYFARPWPSEALKAYRAAIRLDSAYRTDPTIIAHSIELLSSRSSRWSAHRLLERDIGEPALPALDAAAENHANGTIRKRAAAVARAIRKR